MGTHHSLGKQIVSTYTYTFKAGVVYYEKGWKNSIQAKLTTLTVDQFIFDE